MKLLGTVKGQTAMIVGYCQGKRGKVRAIVITQGQLKDVGLKEFKLNDIPKEFNPSVVQLKSKVKGI